MSNSKFISDLIGTALVLPGACLSLSFAFLAERLALMLIANNPWQTFLSTDSDQSQFVADSRARMRRERQWQWQPSTNSGSYADSVPDSRPIATQGSPPVT
ncbi:hypothetical protein FALCPG4_000905 [Fusarium falciforme]